MHWELAQNSTFAVAKSDGERAILRQHCGLPIGGHLSAALVELVALWMEYTTVWPVLLHERVTARYRDIFFWFVQSTGDGFIHDAGNASQDGEGRNQCALPGVAAVI